ncbi:MULTISPECIES: chemotaxis protein CheW [Cytobacillus]|uniref:Chemotaxis protein CheW n=1 Tax=Cytobacillus stercorigallinarum TaxID=2762240 RepID=A0ABR8QMF4_9BACI|nr:chemotaxis protein CheW [Cytobacillus stercorigallinarum]MBD7936703.1 chemotaxis protein CheW [Cytobacillus stercorigallinarum]
MENKQHTVQLIVFQLGDKEYGVPVADVLSIEKIEHITRVPGTEKYIKGVINLRGVILPIVDLRTRFNLPEHPYSQHTRIIITKKGEKEVGLIVDTANDVIDVATSQLEPPPEVVGTESFDYIKAVAKMNQQILILIDLAKVLNIEENVEI